MRLLSEQREKTAVLLLASTEEQTGLGITSMSLVLNIVTFNIQVSIEKEQENTIGTDYPGEGATVLLEGMPMTLEQLGNFTYGFLGYYYGIPLDHLIAGSYYAADFPTEGAALTNELWDWAFVSLGYNVAKEQHQGGNKT